MCYSKSNLLEIESAGGRIPVAKRQTAPLGSWKSPISSDLIVGESVGLGQLALDGADIYWVEARPSEEGRQVLVKRTPDGQCHDLTPRPFSVRTRVHEYGGGAFIVADGVVYFSNFLDQRLYCQRSGMPPEAITPVNSEGEYRYADGVVDQHKTRIICVREDHSPAPPNGPAGPVNTLVGIDCQGQREQELLVSGNDFYSSPRLNPQGTMLAWLTWNHPNMPWDGTELWVSEIADDGSLANLQRVAGGEHESIVEPRWSPDGVLHFVSDQTGWWNLYRWHQGRGPQGQIEALLPMEAEFSRPHWVFGSATYGFQSDSRLICAYNRLGTWHLASLDTDTGHLASFSTSYTEMGRGDLRVQGDRAVFQAGSPSEPMSVLELDLSSGAVNLVRRSSSSKIDSGYLSAPQSIEFPTEGGKSAHAFLYRPKNPDYDPPLGEKPPLLVKSHGGPTGATSTSLDLQVQYWTSRGFAVLDVNYGGSAGYGREYRERLRGHWGIVDVDDCANAALFLVNQGEVDGQRLAIQGGSAGGYTTLAALTFRDVFQAGASHYGVSDLEALAKETHKFESRYLDGLVGPYPQRRDLYLQRSPIRFIDQLSCPLILFQGLEDQIVPPDQAETMFNAVRDKGLPTAYLPFAGEQHGFRQAKNIKRALDAQLYFFSRIFGFELAEPVEPVTIENL